MRYKVYYISGLLLIVASLIVFGVLAQTLEKSPYANGSDLYIPVAMNAQNIVVVHDVNPAGDVLVLAPDKFLTLTKDKTVIIGQYRGTLAAMVKEDGTAYMMNIDVVVTQKLGLVADFDEGNIRVVGNNAYVVLGIDYIALENAIILTLIGSGVIIAGLVQEAAAHEGIIAP